MHAWSYVIAFLVSVFGESNRRTRTDRRAAQKGSRVIPASASDILSRRLNLYYK